MYINYYIKRKDYKMPEDKVMSVHEFHGNCFSVDQDVTSWAAGEKYSCALGFYYADALDRVDWMVTELTWGGIDQPNDQWGCTDGFSTDSTLWTYTVDAVQYCHANGDKSVVDLGADNTGTSTKI